MSKLVLKRDSRTGEPVKKVLAGKSILENENKYVKITAYDNEISKNRSGRSEDLGEK